MKRSQFGSKFGMIAAAAGSAVGLGNIWMFPYVAGQNGGGAFLIIYLLCVLLLGFPALITELSLGRMAQSNPVSAFGRISGRKGWNFIGAMGVLASFLVLGFYFVVAGWSFEYIGQSITTNAFRDMDVTALEAQFATFSTASVRPFLWMALFLVMTAVVIFLGVDKGIEKASKVLMPVLFLVLIYLAIRSAFIPGSEAGYEFYLKPDFSKITAGVALQAMGQAFFSLSIGIGIMLTYGSYMTKGNVVGVSLQICLLDTLVAFMTGLIIFPAVFAYGVEPSSGPNLAFIALPAVFSQMPGGIVFSTLFFFLLAVAALTSTISLYEAIVVTVSELTGLGRRWTIVVTGLALLVVSGLCCASLRPDTTLFVGSRSLFDFFDYFTSDFLLPLGGFFMAVFLGWVAGREKVREALAQFGMGPRFMKVYMVFVRFLVPLMVLLIMLEQFGVFKLINL